MATLRMSGNASNSSLDRECWVIGVQGPERCNEIDQWPERALHVEPEREELVT